MARIFLYGPKTKALARQVQVSTVILHKTTASQACQNMQSGSGCSVHKVIKAAFTNCVKQTSFFNSLASGHPLLKPYNYGSVQVLWSNTKGSRQKKQNAKVQKFMVSLMLKTEGNHNNKYGELVLEFEWNIIEGNSKENPAEPEWQMKSILRGLLTVHSIYMV